MSDSGSKKACFLTKISDFYKKREDGKEKVCFCKIIVTLLIFGIILFSIGKLQQEKNIVGYIIGIILQIPVSLFMMVIAIPICLNRKSKALAGMAITINLLFILSPTLLIFNLIILNKIWFQIINPVILLLLAILLNKWVEIKPGDDVSLLKATNYFMVSIFAVIVFFPEAVIVFFPENDIMDACIKNLLVRAKQMIEFYYIVPLLMLQGLYELFDRKSKQNNEKQDAA